MENSQDNKVEYTDDDDDDSYDMVDWKEFCITDSGEEDSTAETKSQSSEIVGSSDMGSDVEIDMYESHDEMSCYITAAYKKEDSNLFEFPAHIKRKEDMEIKDIVKEHVLPFLPAKSLVRFKAVSREWNQWISSPFLAHKQSYLFREISGFFCQNDSSSPTFMTLDRKAYGVPSPSLSFLPEPVAIRSSCNGLLLCQGQNGENIYYICNPVRKEWNAIPEANYYHHSEPSIVLAYEPSELNFAPDFELVCAFPIADTPMVGFEIYSSEERSWRCPENCIVELEDSTIKGGFYMKGMTYWETSSGKIIAFDMKNELSGILPLPPACEPDGVLTQLHGELCYIRARNHNVDAYTIDIHAGMDMGLRERIALNLGHVGGGVGNFLVLPTVKDGVLVFLVGGVVYTYHLRDQKLQIIRRCKIMEGRYLPYVNSLVPVGSK